MPSQAEIRCECAFICMNAVFRKNLTEALAGDANGKDTAFDPGRRFQRCHGQRLATSSAFECGSTDTLGEAVILGGIVGNRASSVYAAVQANSKFSGLRAPDLNPRQTRR